MAGLVGAIDITVVVLIVAAISKLADPASTSRLFATLGFPRVPRSAPRLVAAVELGVGAWVVLSGTRSAMLALTLTYAMLSAVLARLLWLGSRSATVVSCGCFGVRSAPPTRLHLLLNAASLVAAIGGVISPIDPLSDRLRSQGTAAIAYVALVAIGAGLVIAAHTAGAELSAAVAAIRPRRAGGVS